jgi:hypothetical protein
MMLRTGLAPVRYLVDARDQIEVFENREVFVETEFLSHIAGLAADQRRFADDVASKAAAAPAIGDEKAAQHTDGGGLAAAVGAEKTADLADAHLQRARRQLCGRQSSSSSHERQ